MSGARPSARDLWVALESVHAVTYFAPGCRDALRQAGLPGFWAGYFASRAAPMGAVGAGPVAAAFGNFHPAMVARAVPACWEVASPADLTVRRAAAAAAALGELCGPPALDAVVAALPLLRRAVARCDAAGRVLAGANRDLWPAVEQELRARAVPGRQIAVAEAWQACTTLREHRGDGHVAALTTAGLSGLGAHLLAAGVQGTPVEVLRDNRGWSPEEWEDGARELAGRGLLTAAGSATADGRAAHAGVEALTDALAEVAFAGLADGELADLCAALTAGARETQGSGLLPFPNPMGLPRLAA